MDSETVRLDESTDYGIIHLPDGTTLDVSIDPENGKNHIKLYDDNGYAVMPMDDSSSIRPLEVWGAARRSSARGTSPKDSIRVDPSGKDVDEYEPEFELGDVIESATGHRSTVEDIMVSSADGSVYYYLKKEGDAISTTCLAESIDRCNEKVS